MLKNNVYIPGDSVPITDIGPQPGNRSDAGSTLVCVTTNVNTACCRYSDGGAVGECIILMELEFLVHMNIYRVGYAEQVRLSSEITSEGPLGAYRCEVLDGETGTTISATIYIIPPSKILP